MRVFITACETRCMRDAARRLRLTQPRVSQVIKGLERDLEAPLFDRTLRPMGLTSAGAMLFQKAQRLIEEAEGTRDEIRRHGSGLWPELRIGISDSLSVTLVPLLVRSLRQRVKSLSVWVGSSSEACRALAGRDLDLVISCDPMTSAMHLERYELCREPIVLLSPRDVALPTGPDRDRERIAYLAERLPLIRYSTCSPLARQIGRLLEHLAVHLPNQLEFNTSEAIVHMVAERLGWAISTPLCVLQSRADTTKVVLTPLRGARAQRSIMLIGREGELGDLPRIVARLSCDIMREEAVPLVRSMLGNAGDQVRVPSHLRRQAA
jgi:DNA-binding transcriptional LysR family regulator